MAPIIWAHVVDHISVLSSVDPDQQTDLVNFANAYFNPNMFGGEDSPTLKLARIYLVGHFASEPGAGSAAPAGPLIMQKRDKFEQRFQGTEQGGSEDWNLTQWGRRLKQLIRTSRARLPTVA